MEVRACGPGDLEETAALYDRAVLHLTKTVNYPKWEYGVYPSSQSVQKAISEGVQYLCTENGTAVGAFILNDDPQGAYERGDWQRELQRGEFLVIHTLAVDPDRLGRGVGRFMVECCIARARQLGYQAIRLDVVPDNLPARRLYEACGFSFAGEKDLERGLEEIPTFALYELNL